MTEDGDAHRRGMDEGRTAERLDGHDRHFAMINGQLRSVADRMAEMVLQMQRLADADVARVQQATVVTQALQNATAKRWTPWARLATVIGAVTAIVATGVSIYLAARS